MTTFNDALSDTCVLFEMSTALRDQYASFGNSMDSVWNQLEIDLPRMEVTINGVRVHTLGALTSRLSILKHFGLYDKVMLLINQASFYPAFNLLFENVQDERYLIQDGDPSKIDINVDRGVVTVTCIKQFKEIDADNNTYARYRTATIYPFIFPGKPNLFNRVELEEPCLGCICLN